MFEDLKKSQRGGLSPSRGLFGILHVSDPRMRVYVMAGLFVLLLAIAFGLKMYAGSDEAKQMTQQTVPSQEVPARVTVSWRPPIAPAPALYSQIMISSLGSVSKPGLDEEWVHRS